MGADLYGSFYFRDAYNSASLFWAMGLSWWRLLEDKAVMSGEQITPAGARVLLARLRDPRRRAFYRDQLAKMSPLVRRLVSQKYRLFSRLLGDCIRSGEPIRCSV